MLDIVIWHHFLVLKAHVQKTDVIISSYFAFNHFSHLNHVTGQMSLCRYFVINNHLYNIVTVSATSENFNFYLFFSEFSLFIHLDFFPQIFPLSSEFWLQCQHLYFIFSFILTFPRILRNVALILLNMSLNIKKKTKNLLNNITLFTRWNNLFATQVG